MAIRYRIRVSVRKDGTKLYYPQYNYGLFWRSIKTSTTYDTWVVECESEEEAREYIARHASIEANYKEVDSFYKEII